MEMAPGVFVDTNIQHEIVETGDMDNDHDLILARPQNVRNNILDVADKLDGAQAGCWGGFVLGNQVLDVGDADFMEDLEKHEKKVMVRVSLELMDKAVGKGHYDDEESKKRWFNSMAVLSAKCVNKDEFDVYLADITNELTCRLNVRANFK